MGKKLSFVFAGILLIVGIAVLSYPIVSSYVNQKHGSYAIAALQQQISRAEKKEIFQIRQQAYAYNMALQRGNAPENYDSVLNIAGGMMGYITIPEIHVDLPIYHGVSEEILAKGVGHMPQSALPTGGNGNHCVLTGHTGLPSAKLFTDLVDLKEGDLFYLSVLSDTLAYRIDQIKVVLPSESQDLAAQSGKDYCTLVTCTPYGINSHRLLVRGIRTDLPTGNDLQPGTDIVQNDGVYILFLLPIVIAAFVCGLRPFLHRKRHKYEKT